MDFEPDVELLSGEKVLLVRREDTAQGGTRAKPLEGLPSHRRNGSREGGNKRQFRHAVVEFLARDTEETSMKADDLGIVKPIGLCLDGQSQLR